jgi:hypothetical protein
MRKEGKRKEKKGVTSLLKSNKRKIKDLIQKCSYHINSLFYYIDSLFYKKFLKKMAY